MSGLPLTSSSPTDKQPALWVLSFLYTVYAVLALAVRFALRRKFQPSDQVLIGGYVIGLVNWALLWTALSKGLAKATSVIAPGSYATVSRLVYGGIVTLFVAQACAMASQCLFIGEHLARAKQTRHCQVAAVVTCALSIGALLSILAGCEGTSYLNTGADGCSDQTVRWAIASVLLALGSCVPAALSVFAFKQLQTRLDVKIKLYLAFSSAILNIPLLGGIAGTAHAYYTHGRDSLDAMPWLVCLQTLLLLSFISASVPCAPRIALKFTTAGLVFLDEATSGANQSTGSNKNRQLSGARLASTGTKSVDVIRPVPHPDNAGTHFVSDASSPSFGDQSSCPSLTSSNTERYHRGNAGR